MKSFVLVLALAALAVAPARADDAAAMAAAANAFYSTYAALPRAGGIPNATIRARYAPLLSPRLTKLIVDAAAAEARFRVKYKDSPPLIEGDLFSSLFEGISSFKLAACSGNDKSGSCAARLHYEDPGQKPEDWTDTVILVNTPSGWKVDDIAYQAGFAFGNTGFLSQTLKTVIAEAP